MTRHGSPSGLFVLASLLCLSTGAINHAAEVDISGCVVIDKTCDGVLDHSDIGLEGVRVVLSDPGGIVAETTTINDLANGVIGLYEFALTLDDFTDPSQVEVSIDTSTLPTDVELVTVQCESSACLVAGNPTILDLTISTRVRGKLNFLYCIIPQEGDLCWFTAGGVKFESITREWSAECGAKGPSDSVGGVAFPSCSQFPSNGGQWNHVAHSLKLHLLGFDQEFIRCGNVDGIDPGSESPECPNNFIEFRGTGRVQGIKGNKVLYDPVTYFVRAEDHNEPGNEQSAKSGADIDRYFLRVMDADGNVLILVDEDGDPETVDPVTISGGNFQMHCTSCDDSSPGGAVAKSVRPDLRRLPYGSPYFLRGDANTDGLVDQSDAIYTLGYLYLGSEQPKCLDAADCNDDGEIDVSDPIVSLTTVFLGNATIPSPYPSADRDSTDDILGCGLLD